MQRLKTVRVQQFQSIEDVTLDLAPFVVVVGHSNAGKSALIRALQAALFNWTGGAFVREGADEAQVDLIFERSGPAGHILRWTKPKKGGARYVVSDGAVVTEISRVGKEMPPEIAELTGIREIECEGAKAVLNLDQQFDAPFMLAGTGGQAARLLAKVTKSDVMVTAQIRARKDLEAKRRAADKAVEDADACVAQLAVLPDYDALLATWNALVDRHAFFEHREAAVERCKFLASEQDRLNRLILAVRSADLGSRVEAVQEQAVSLSAKAGLIAEAVTARDASAVSKRVLRDCKNEAKKAEEALHDVMGKLDVCPLCGKVMNDAG